MIFAEIGLNHLGSKSYAKYYLKNIFKSNVDGVTFQIKKKSFYLNYKEAYQKKDLSFYHNFKDKKIYELLFKKKKFQSLALTKKFYQKVRKECKIKKKLFGIALGDEDLVDFFSSIDVDFIKVLSEDFENTSLIKKLLNSKIKKIYLSVGNISNTKINFFFNNLSKKNIKKINLIYTNFDKKQKSESLKKINQIKKHHYLVSYGLHANNKQFLLKIINFKPDSIFFYIKGNKLKFHPDDSHALTLSQMSYYSDKLKKSGI